MADIHVFADMDLIKDQYDASPWQGELEAYGPVKNNEESEYRLTSRFKFAQDVTAYAAFDSIAIIQDQTDFPAVVNLILYNVGLGRRYPTPKVMIYRGLRREDFLTGSGVNSQLQVKQSSGFTSDLIKNIWDHFNEWKALLTQSGLSTTLTAPSYDLLGYMAFDDNAPNKRAPWSGTENLFRIFLQSASQKSYKAFPIRKGWSIGRFRQYTTADPIRGGIEVVLEGNKFEFTFDKLREQQNIVSVVPQTSLQPGNESIGTMKIRERILDYIDPAALYNHYRQFGVDYGSTTLRNDQVYDRVVSRFRTHNKIYIELRNQNDYSLNYGQDNMDQATKTDNFKVGVNVGYGNTVVQNYYQYRWPIYTTDVRVNSVAYNEVYLGFRKEFNPTPLLYHDGADPLDNNYFSSRFLYDHQPRTASWTDDFKFYTPNYAALTGRGPSAKTSTAWVVRLYVIRKEMPTTNLPARTVPSIGYFDYVLGPIQDYGPLPANYSSLWYIGGPKKYVNCEEELGGVGDAMVQTGHYETAGELVFYGQLLDDNFNVDKAIQGAKQVLPVNGKSDSAAFSQTVKSWNAATDVYLKVLLKIGSATKETLRMKSGYESLVDHGLLTLHMSRDTYRNRVLPAANRLSSTDHLIFFGADSFSKLKDDDDKPYRQMLLTVAGVNGVGTYTREVPDGGNLIAYSTDDVTFTCENTGLSADTLQLKTDQRAYFPAWSSTDSNNLIAFVEAMEKAYEGLDLNAQDTLTRVRMQYYGWNYFRANWAWGSPKSSTKLSLQGAVFAHSIPYREIFEHNNRFSFRNLTRDWGESKYPNDAAARDDYYNAYDYLESLADENFIRDNPSPMVLDPLPASDPKRLRIDLGHALFGLDALTHGEIIASPYYDKFNIGTSIDLAGAVADIAPPVAHYFMHLLRGHSTGTGAHYPQNPDLDREWEISAPDADLIGDAESFGLWAAWQKVEADSIAASTTFKFSDVLKWYYDPTNPRDEHFTHRWKIYCLANGYIDASGVWQVTSRSHPIYQDLYRRVADFALFWCNIVEHAENTAAILRLDLLDTLEPERDAYATLENDPNPIYFVIDRFFAKLQAWLALEN